MLTFYKKVIQLRQIYKSPSLLPKKKERKKGNSTKVEYL